MRVCFNRYFATQGDEQRTRAERSYAFYKTKGSLSDATRACARWPELSKLMHIRVSDVHGGFLGSDIADLQVGHLWRSGVGC